VVPEVLAIALGADFANGCCLGNFVGAAPVGLVTADEASGEDSSIATPNTPRLGCNQVSQIFNILIFYFKEFIATVTCL
jgi:hypothetical protein